MSGRHRLTHSRRAMRPGLFGANFDDGGGLRLSRRTSRKDSHESEHDRKQRTGGSVLGEVPSPDRNRTRSALAGWRTCRSRRGRHEWHGVRRLVCRKRKHLDGHFAGPARERLTPPPPSSGGGVGSTVLRPRRRGCPYAPTIAASASSNRLLADRDMTGPVRPRRGSNPRGRSPGVRASAEPKSGGPTSV